MESLRPQETNLGDTLADVKRMMDEINHPNFKAMIDTCAMGVSGETPEQWFNCLGDENIIHMHFIDGTPYGHLIWGDGKHNLENWLKTLKKHNYKGLLSQEITAIEYCFDPAAADIRNYQQFKPFME